MQPTESRPNAVRIVVADGHPIFRQGLVKLLETRPNLIGVGSAGTGDEALALIRTLEPDVLLLDMLMPGTPAIAALRQLKSLGTKTRILIVTATIDRTDLTTALELGARGVVLKESASDVLFKSIQAVMAGEYWVARKAVATLGNALKEITAAFPDPKQKHFGLTPRELEIVSVILTGSSNLDIAAKFSISEKTVKHHLTNIFDKLGVSSRLELALFALHYKLDLSCGVAAATPKLLKVPAESAATSRAVNSVTAARPLPPIRPT
jgi:two-component system nitrate/nitrite response regulator NarL